MNELSQVAAEFLKWIERRQNQKHDTLPKSHHASFRHKATDIYRIAEQCAELTED